MHPPSILVGMLLSVISPVGPLCLPGRGAAGNLLGDCFPLNQRRLRDNTIWTCPSFIYPLSERPWPWFFSPVDKWDGRHEEEARLTPPLCWPPLFSQWRVVCGLYVLPPFPVVRARIECSPFVLFLLTLIFHHHHYPIIIMIIIIMILFLYCPC